ncbi:MAG: pyridoxal 5'-phosphate synthase glutaminase subunit PdxT [Ilumatobacteraceae bacterium]
MNIGILALQGAFAAHQRVLTDLGASVTLVRGVEDVNDLDGIVLPGGESTTMSMLLDSSGIAAPLRERVRNGFPVFGTCAGLILLAEKIVDGRADQQQLGGLAITARRNGYGRQIDSFESSISICEAENTFAMNGVFIRAPRIEEATGDVEVLGTVNGDVVLVRQGNILGATFHPELSDDHRVHEMFLKMVSRYHNDLEQAQEVRS